MNRAALCRGFCTSVEGRVGASRASLDRADRPEWRGTVPLCVLTAAAVCGGCYVL
eukprot:CAMPEP_0180380462 /NCGR_PEP_ID=MMETSP0989-20121125/26037_1 /TAXON_ID=697907 /ORGANISM="non described non described, Strain CCMP2293" /LENGTH=54 /DNA_ID=CAMNT_0022379897 /DNA_START=151 /DNA_END=311 /DNA_ORIENTATION=-